MAELTIKEKAERYDALQVAIDLMLDSYKRREQDAKANYKGVDVISIYNKGKADAYNNICKTLRVFKN